MASTLAWGLIANNGTTWIHDPVEMDEGLNTIDL